MDAIKWVTHEKTTAKNIHKKPTEKLTKKELEELMGVHRPRYVKCGGAFRQK